MTPDHDEDLTIERIVSAKRRLTDLKLRVLLDEEPGTDDIDAVADEVLAGLDRLRPVDRGNTVRVDPVAG